MKNHTSLFVATAMTAAVSALSSGSLHAKEATPPVASSTIEEVLVTARRRSESMQEIPVSMTALYLVGHCRSGDYRYFPCE